MANLSFSKCTRCCVKVIPRRQRWYTVRIKCMRLQIYVHKPEYLCNTAIVVVEHKSHQTTAPWEKGQRQT